MRTRQTGTLFFFVLVLSPFAAVGMAGKGNEQTIQRIDVGNVGPGDSQPVPDEVAYRHLLTALASSDRLQATERDVIRRRIAKIGLPQTDSTYLETTLILLGVRDTLTRIASDRASLGAAAAARSQTAIAKLQLLRTEEEDLMRLAKSQVIQGLTREGAAILDRYVLDTVKPQITTIRGEHKASN